MVMTYTESAAGNQSHDHAADVQTESVHSFAMPTTTFKSKKSNCRKNKINNNNKDTNNDNNNGYSTATSNKTARVENSAPDGGWGWFVVLGVCVVHVILAGFERSNGIIFLQLRDRFESSATETSWVFSIFSSFRLLMAPVATMLCQRFSCRSVVMTGSLLCTAGIAMSGFVSSIHVLYFTYGVLGGFGRALVYAPSLVTVGQYFNRRRGIAVGIATAGVGIGTIVWPPLTEHLFLSYGYQGTFLLLGGLISHYFICGALFRPLDLHLRLLAQDRNYLSTETVVENGISNEAFEYQIDKGEEITNTDAFRDCYTHNTSNTENNVSKTLQHSTVSSIQEQQKTIYNPETDRKCKVMLLDLSLLRNKHFLAFCIQVCLFSLSFETAFVFLPALAKERGIPPLQSAYVVSILGACDGVARIGLAAILDIAAVKRYRLIAYNAFMFMVGVVAVLIPSMTTFWHFVVVGAFYGILTGVLISQLSVVVVDILGVEKLASAIGIIFLFQGISSLVGPIVGGAMKDAFGGFNMSFYVGAVGIFCGAVVMVIGNVSHYRGARGQDKTESPVSTTRHNQDE